MKKQRFTRRKLSYGVPIWVIAFVFLFFAVLNATGAYTYDELLDDLGFQRTNSADSPLSVHFIDVEQGDCMLVSSQGENVLIDCGESDYAEVVLDYLNQQGITHLDKIINTHPHSDHMGGMSVILTQIGCDEFIMPDVDDDDLPTTRVFENMLIALDEENIPVTYAEPGQSFKIGEGVMTILAPLSDKYDSLNNYSVVCRLVHGSNSFLFTGDAESESEKELLNANIDLSADVLKVGHHGSSTSTKKKFLEAVMPSIGIICCDDNNSYNHPHQSTVERLQEHNVRIYRTDLNGTIVISSDGTKLDISTAE